MYSALKKLKSNKKIIDKFGLDTGLFLTFYYPMKTSKPILNSITKSKKKFGFYIYDITSFGFVKCVHDSTELQAN